MLSCGDKSNFGVTMSRQFGKTNFIIRYEVQIKKACKILMNRICILQSDDLNSRAILNSVTIFKHKLYIDQRKAFWVTSFEEFQTKKPPKKDRYEVLAMITYSISNGYIIAGESDPDVALLDIFSMVTLGRIIFEEEGPLRYGKTVQPIIRGFRKAEKDIRKIAAVVLKPDQLGYLMSIIKGWRKENPGLAFYPSTKCFYQSKAFFS